MEENDDESTEMNSSKKYSKRKTRAMKTKNEIIVIPAEINLNEFEHCDSSVTIDEIAIISNQLGYLPYNLIRISAYNPFNSSIPAVSTLYPLNYNNMKGRYSIKEGLKPFPTIFWMTCPLLIAKIAKLEEDGYVQIFQDRLVNESTYEKYEQIQSNAHKLYADERWNLLSFKDQEYIIAKDW